MTDIRILSINKAANELSSWLEKCYDDKDSEWVNENISIICCNLDAVGTLIEITDKIIGNDPPNDILGRMA